MRIETVKIKADTERGWCLINKGDFDSEKHKMFNDYPSVGKPAKGKAAKPKLFGKKPQAV